MMEYRDVHQISNCRTLAPRPQTGCRHPRWISALASLGTINKLFSRAAAAAELRDGEVTLP